MLRRITMDVRTSRRTGALPVVLICLSGILTALVSASSSPLRADWLVLVDGARVETRGPWQVRGRMVTFTDAKGTFSSLRVDEVDLEASEAATRAAAEAPAGEGTDAAAPPAPPPPPPPVLVLTDADVGRGGPVATGVDALIEKLRQAHGFGNVDAAMALVHWEGATADVRQALRTDFAFMMARPLIAIERLEAAAEDTAPTERAGVVYRPNLPVTGKLRVRLEPIAEDGDVDTASVTFLIGELLGTHLLIAGAPAGG